MLFRSYYDASSRKVKWGPFFDATDQVLTYQVTPPNNATNTATFLGVASYDGIMALISGNRKTTYDLTPTEFSAQIASYTLNEGFTLSLRGPSNASFTIQASTNLVNWTPLATNTATTGMWQFLDRDATNYPIRFYRAWIP